MKSNEQAHAREDLIAIRRIMEGSQQVVEGAGPHFAGWGVLTSAALVATWLMVDGGNHAGVPWLWAGTVAAGWAMSGLLGRRARRAARVRTTGGRMIGGLWLATGITLTLLGFAGPGGGAVAPDAITGMLSAVLGGAYFATGLLSGHRWLLAVGGGWWAGALFMLLFPAPHGLLVMAAMMLLLQAAPGVYIMRGPARQAAAA
jgi:hypothetical protein